MNVAQMMNNRGAIKKAPEDMPIGTVQDRFRTLSDDQIDEAVQLARRQGISEQQISEGLRMIRSLKK